jgi:predicted TPR repeat methyltransferase
VQKELGQAAEAEQSYRAVLAARPGFAPAWNNLGVVLKMQERYADAAEAYRACLALAPEFADCWVNLGNALRALGEAHDAMTAYHKAILLAPQSLDAYRNLGQSLVTAGRHAEALEVYRQWQLQDPQDSAIAHMIAALEGGPSPERASDNYVQNTFDRFASSFEDVLIDLQYRAPQVCGELVAAIVGAPAGTLAVLDAGCGTGLCAPVLLPYARVLDGVDLSPKMLERAAQRGSYGKLEEAELSAWLAAHPDSYDLIVSADTLCYFGALADVLTNAAATLRPGGHLVFTLEETPDAALAPQFKLNPHGRYSHTQAYACAMLEQAGLTVLEVRRTALRLESDAPVTGLAIAATK